MTLKPNNAAFQTTMALLLCSNLSSANASFFTPVDVSADPANQNSWIFSDGTQNINNAVTLNTLPALTINGQPTTPTTPYGFVNNNESGFWTATFSFTTNAFLNLAFLDISQFSSDDRAELLLNGLLVAATGLFDTTGTPCTFSNALGDSTPGFLGLFQSTPGGTSQPQCFTGSNSSYDYGISNNLDPVLINVGHVNTLEVIVNNTNDGIYGTAGSSGPTHFSLDATVFVPEPATIALLALGLMGLGISRKKQIQA